MKNNELFTYEILEDGYHIFKDDVLYIVQQKPFIPYPKLTYEEGAKKQIEELMEPYLQNNDNLDKNE